MKKISSHLLSGLISSVFFALPVPALAAIQITEVMYDTPGGDSGREWIEVTNTGREAVDIAKYKLAEGGTNHGFKIAAGNTFLAPGTSAILVEDVATFKADWPSFNGTIFDSAFSLSNTGETLSIKNASSSAEDTVTFTSSMGASGDSGSLHRSGETFVAALPNPGMYPGELKPVPVVEKSVSTPVVKTTKAKTKKSTSSASTKTAAAAVPENTFDPSTQDTAPASPSFIYWVLGLAALCAVGVGGVVVATARGGSAGSLASETKREGEEFEIVET